jgi:alkylation response protein AidB-like acyl-CoA dehydrogenase
MDLLTFSAEQDALRDVARSFLRSSSPESEVRRLMETDSGYDAKVWKQMADQLGLQGLLIPEALGGSGASFTELGIVLEEMGSVLFCSPYLSTALLATTALLEAKDENAMDDYLPSIAAGETIATLALAEDSGSWDANGIVTAGTRTGGQWLLNGSKMFVTDGHIADLIIVLARTGAGLSLFAVNGSGEGVRRTPLVTMDPTRKQARVEFNAAPARIVGIDGDGGEVVDRILDRAAVGLAAEQVGGAQRCLDMAVSYAQQRVQFGRLIGSFQAIKHRCAEVLLQVESARSAAYDAMSAATAAPDQLPVAACVAGSYCSDAYYYAAASNIQVHGGIGFTWEHPAHLYFKRAKSSELLFGDATHYRELLARRLGI